MFMLYGSIIHHIFQQVGCQDDTRHCCRSMDYFIIS